MSKKQIQNSSIVNELAGSAFFMKEHKKNIDTSSILKKQVKEAESKAKEQDNKNKSHEDTNDVTSPTDVTTSPTDVTNNHNSSDDRTHSLDVEKLQTIIGAIVEVPTTAQNMPVRLSAQERKDIDDFIYETLRKKGVQGKGVSTSKLMRYSLRYVMQVHRTEFVRALTNALKRETQLPI
ncbi:MAG: hypothetical protein KDC47_07855 [Flavobacteriaceae bacterium]|nr:hypothetical protein [Flavobacteriaceae bacterium]